MLVSYEHRFLFIHVPKTGGSSVRNALLPFALDPLHAFENRWLQAIGIRVNHYSPYRRKRFRGHQSAETVSKNIPGARTRTALQVWVCEEPLGSAGLAVSFRANPPKPPLLPVGRFDDVSRVCRRLDAAGRAAGNAM